MGRELIEKDTKTHQVRTVSLDEETTALLAAHHARCEALAYDCGAELSSTSFLFSHEVDFSQPWRPNYATLAFGRLRSELGLDGVKLHHLRHFSATQLLSIGIDVRTVSGRLGHANASTTLDIYAQFVRAADDAGSGIAGGAVEGCDVGGVAGSGEEVLEGPGRHDQAPHVEPHGVELALLDHVADRSRRDLQAGRHLVHRVDERRLAPWPLVPADDVRLSRASVCSVHGTSLPDLARAREPAVAGGSTSTLSVGLSARISAALRHPQRRAETVSAR